MDHVHIPSRRRYADPPVRHLCVTIPLPCGDNAGIPFPAADISWFETELLKINSGYRKHLWTRGAWDDHGVSYDEPTVVYVITLALDQLSALSQLLQHARIVFRQQMVWAECHSVEVITLTASTDDHGPHGLSGLVIPAVRSAAPSS